MVVILLSDILSNKGGVMYGRAGELVTVISIHDDVFIVEGSKGRFSVHKSKIRLSNVTEENTQRKD